MRISTVGFQNNALSGILDLQSALNESQAQLASGRRVQKVSDDPLAASHILRISQEVAFTERFDLSISSATNILEAEEAVLSSFVEQMHRMRELVVQSGNTGSLSPSDQEAIALEMEQLNDGLLNLANARNSEGQYLFSGFRGNQKPFVMDASGRQQYLGDQGQRFTEIGPESKIALNDAGSNIFISEAGPNSYFTQAHRDNSGTGLISRGQVFDPVDFEDNFAEGFTIVFNAANPLPNFDVFDNTDLSTPLAGYDDVQYHNGDPILVHGLKVNVSGVPLPGDKFEVNAASKHNIFDSFHSLRAMERAKP